MDAVERIDAVLRGTMEPGRVDGAYSPKRAVERFIHDSGVGALRPAVRAHFLKALGEDPTDLASTKAAHALVRSGAVGWLPPESAEATAKLFRSLSSTERAHLASFALRPGSSNALRLASVDGLGTSVAVHLGRLQAAAPLVARSTLEILAHPTKIPLMGGDLGAFNLLLFAMADYQPAELVRLILAQVSEGRTAEPPFLPLLQNGKANQAPLELGRRVITTADLQESASDLLRVNYQTVRHPQLARKRWLERRYSHAPWVVSLQSVNSDAVFLAERVTEKVVVVRGPTGPTPTEWLGVRMVPIRKVLDPDLGTFAIASHQFWERFDRMLEPEPT